MKSIKELGNKIRKESIKGTSEESMQEMKQGTIKTCMKGKWQRNR